METGQYEEMKQAMETMREEIASLKEALAEKERAIASHGPDMTKVKAMLDEGYAKVVEAVRPLLDEAESKLGEPTRRAVHRAEEKITMHPFTAIMIALGTGFVAGKALDLVNRATWYRESDVD